MFSVFIFLITQRDMGSLQSCRKLSSTFVVEVEKRILVFCFFLTLSPVSRAVTLNGITFLKNQMKPMIPFFRGTTPQTLQQIQYLAMHQNHLGRFCKIQISRSRCSKGGFSRSGIEHGNLFFPKLSKQNLTGIQV